MVTDRQRHWWTLFAAVAGVTAVRLAFCNATELLPEEAYYWTYGQNPALSYFDHPPMVAWIISAGCQVFGNTELGVRVVNMILWILSCFTLVNLARQWWDERVAVGAGLMYCALPIYLGAGFIVTPDGVLLYFWLVALQAITRAVQTGKTRYWLVAGVGFGGAMLSKYYAVILAPSLVLFLAFSRQHRVWLRRPQPWLAAVVAALVFSPVVIWNATHDWASFAFQSTRTVGQHGLLGVRQAEFWGAQLAMVTPVGLALFIVAGWQAVRRGWREGQEAWNFAAAFSLPLFGVFVAASVKTDVHVNWTAPAFLALLPAASALWWTAIDRQNPRWRWWRTGSWIVAGISIAVVVAGHFILATGRPKLFAYSRVGGWRALAREVAATEKRLADRTGQRPFIIGADKYNIAAELGFYLQCPADCVNEFALGKGGVGYRFWIDRETLRDRPAVIVMFGDKAKTKETIARHFVTIGEPRALPIGTHGKKSRAVFLIEGLKYRPAAAPTEADLD